MLKRSIRQYHNSAFKAGDLCLLRQVNRPDKKYLTKLLEPGAEHVLHKGNISHDHIIGSLPRSKVITTSANLRFSITRPTLDDFIEMSSRDAQPIYSQDAASIVSLADLHVDYPKIVDGKVLDQKHYLEAGTGHGSLTIAIARMLHAANCYGVDDKDLRGAILHTIDNREIHSKRGQKNLKMFNNGMYFNDVDFHIDTSPSNWLINHEANGTEFLSGTFLDMPDPEEELPEISKHLKVNSPLLIFSPSVTQILKVVKLVNENKSDWRLTFTQCVELAPGGLREWDVRSTLIRATGKMGDVARPKVGVRVVGGGFVGVFRKIGAPIKQEKEIDVTINHEGEIESAIEQEKETDVPVKQDKETDEKGVEDEAAYT